MGLWPASAERVVEQDGVRVYEGPPTLPQLLQVPVVADPGACAAVAIGGGSLTYGELWEQTARVAGGLQSLGVEPGDRVGILMANSLELLVGTVAAWRAGAVAATLNTKYTSTELDPLIRACGPRVLLTQPEWAGRADSQQAGTVVTDLGSLRGPFDPPALTPRDPAVLMYTSGTTGFAKGALQSHRNVVSAAETFVRCLPLEPGDSTVVAAPMFHVTGLNGQLLPVLASGGTVTIMPRFDAELLVELLSAGKASFFHAAPTIYTMATRAARTRRANGLRACVCGGALVSRGLVDAVRELARGVDFRISYGMTETSSPAVLTPPGWIDDRPGDAAGIAVPVDDVAVDSDGEILFRGATVISSYDRNPEATASASADGWLRSGDLGTIDADGFVTVLDRLKDMINRGGEKISSLEVESVLTEHDAVLETAVVGAPDEVYGEVPRAFVVASEAVEGDELRAFAARRLARFKVPAEIVFVDELPRNPGGKVLKQELRGG